MKKRYFLKCVIAGIVLLLFLFWSLIPVVADTAQDQLIQKVREEPFSIFAIAKHTWDFLGEAAKRFAGSAKPLVVFNGGARMGGEISIYEEKLFAITMGKYLKDDREDPNTLEFEDGWFFGLEFKLPEWPKGTDFGEMVSKARPQIVFHQGSCYFGLSYKFRNEI